MSDAWKKYKLKKTWDYQNIIKRKKRLFNDQFTVFFCKRSLDKNFTNLANCRFGISVPQKMVKRAFLRNRYKRQIREMIICFFKSNKKILINFQDLDFVIIVRQSFKEYEFAENKKSLFCLLKSIFWKTNRKGND